MATMTKPATRKSRFSADYARIATLLSNESMNALRAGDDLAHTAIRKLQNTVSTLARGNPSNEDVLALVEEEKSSLIQAAWNEYDAWEQAQGDMAWTWAEEGQRVQDERVLWKLALPRLEDDEQQTTYCKVCGIVAAPHDCPAWDTDADDEAAEWEAAQRNAELREEWATEVVWALQHGEPIPPSFEEWLAGEQQEEERLCQFDEDWMAYEREVGRGLTA